MNEEMAAWFQYSWKLEGIIGRKSRKILNICAENHLVLSVEKEYFLQERLVGVEDWLT